MGAAPPPRADGRLAVASVVAGLAAGAAGYYDDLAGGAAKGIAGHLGALRHGRVTTGVVKMVGHRRRELARPSALLAGPAAAPYRPRSSTSLWARGSSPATANLVNLLDLRPGRALKAGLTLGVPLALSPTGAAAAGTVGCAAALIADDLAERVMLGDAGANSLGALLGVALAARTGSDRTGSPCWPGWSPSPWRASGSASPT